MGGIYGDSSGFGASGVGLGWGMNIGCFAVMERGGECVLRVVEFVRDGSGRGEIRLICGEVVDVFECLGRLVGGFLQVK